jgi:hypothetical protein
LAGINEEGLESARSHLFMVDKTQFETQVEIPKGLRYVRAAALDKYGVILGSTNIVDMATGQILIPGEGVKSLDRLICLSEIELRT